MVTTNQGIKLPTESMSTKTVRVNAMATIPPKFITNKESLEADGSITVYSLESGRVVAQYEGLEIHEAMQENASLREENDLLHAEITRLQKQYDETERSRAANFAEASRLRERVTKDDLDYYQHQYSEDQKTIAALRERVAALEGDLEYIRDLARTGLPPTGYSGENWAQHKLNRIAAKSGEALTSEGGA